MKKTSLIAVAYEIPFPREFTRQEEPWRASHLWGGSESGRFASWNTTEALLQWGRVHRNAERLVVGMHRGSSPSLMKVPQFVNRHMHFRCRNGLLATCNCPVSSNVRKNPDCMPTTKGRPDRPGCHAQRASMGLRSSERGMVLTPRGSNGVVGASMGPRSSERGMASLRKSRCAVNRASMGSANSSVAGMIRCSGMEMPGKERPWIGLRRSM